MNVPGPVKVRGSMHMFRLVSTTLSVLTVALVDPARTAENRARKLWSTDPYDVRTPPVLISPYASCVVSLVVSLKAVSCPRSQVSIRDLIVTSVLDS